MLNESLLEGGVGGEARVVRVIPGNGLVAVGAADAVAGVGHPLGIAASLRAIFLDRIAAEFAAAGPKLGRPANHGDGQQWLRAAAFSVWHEKLRPRPRGGRGPHPS